MTSPTSFAELSQALRAWIRAGADGSGSKGDSFAALALALFRLQFAHNAPYRRLCEFRRVTPENITDWRAIPAVPAGAFKELELTSLAPHERATVFHSSGTTAQKPSRHFHCAESLALYEASLLPWFERHLLADLDALREGALIGPLDRLPFLSLTPPPEAVPHSSLVHMLGAVGRGFGSRDSLFVGGLDSAGAWTLDMERALFAIRKCLCANRPLVLLGTAFNFVHLLDHFAAANRRYRLARGSRVLETGGYKGRSRQVPKAELHALITKHLGIPASHIVTEYGMSELSSQAYDRAVGAEGPGGITIATTNDSGDPGEGGTRDADRSSAPVPERSPLLRFPPWCRALIVSPETGCEVAVGETGLLRIFDLANVRSVMAVQTEDLAVRHDDGFELRGRAAAAEARGCSLMSASGEGRGTP